MLHTLQLFLAFKYAGCRSNNDLLPFLYFFAYSFNTSVSSLSQSTFLKSAHLSNFSIIALSFNCKSSIQSSIEKIFKLFSFSKFLGFCFISFFQSYTDNDFKDNPSDTTPVCIIFLRDSFSEYTHKFGCLDNKIFHCFSLKESKLLHFVAKFGYLIKISTQLSGEKFFQHLHFFKYFSSIVGNNLNQSSFENASHFVHISIKFLFFIINSTHSDAPNHAMPDIFL